MSDNQFGEYGLTGDSGFIGDCHFSAPYDCNGMVFVEDESDIEFTGVTSWERMPLEQALEEGRVIIKCFYCDIPAVSLDHSWPWLQEGTFCAKHFKERNK